MKLTEREFERRSAQRMKDAHEEREFAEFERECERERARERKEVAERERKWWGASKPDFKETGLGLNSEPFQTEFFRLEVAVEGLHAYLSGRIDGYRGGLKKRTLSPSELDFLLQNIKICERIGAMAADLSKK